MNCELSIENIMSNVKEGNRFVIRIQNRKENVFIEVKLNAEQFSNLIMGNVIDGILKTKGASKLA